MPRKKNETKPVGDGSPARGASETETPPVPNSIDPDVLRMESEGGYQFPDNIFLGGMGQPMMEYTYSGSDINAPRDSTDALLSDNAVVNFVDKYLTTDRVLRIREELGCPPEAGAVVAGVHASLVRDGLGDYQALSLKQQRAVGGVAAQRTRAVLQEQAAA